MAAKPNETHKGEKLPADVYVAGPNWLLFTPEADGRFPYSAVVPVPDRRE